MRTPQQDRRDDQTYPVKSNATRHADGDPPHWHNWNLNAKLHDGEWLRRSVCWVKGRCGCSCCWNWRRCDANFPCSILHREGYVDRHFCKQRSEFLLLRILRNFRIRWGSFRIAISHHGSFRLFRSPPVSVLPLSGLAPWSPPWRPETPNAALPRPSLVWEPRSR
jgi:hypothetical protein